MEEDYFIGENGVLESMDQDWDEMWSSNSERLGQKYGEFGKNPPEIFGVKKKKSRGGGCQVWWPNGGVRMWRGKGKVGERKYLAFLCSQSRSSKG